MARRQTYGSPALLVKTVASYTVPALFKDEAFQTRKALIFSSLNILTQKSSPKVRENQLILPFTAMRKIDDFYHIHRV
jgi:hypothetical protein